MTHRLLHAEAALVEALAVSVDNINKPDWSRVKIKASDCKKASESRVR